MKATKTTMPQEQRLKMPKKTLKVDTNLKLDKKSFDAFFNKMIKAKHLVEKDLAKKK